jgi:hypothetical protein
MHHLDHLPSPIPGEESFRAILAGARGSSLSWFNQFALPFFFYPKIRALPLSLVIFKHGGL